MNRTASITSIILWLSFLPLAAISQTKQLDSLRKVAENAPAPERSGIYVELANLAKNNHPDTALFFARRSMHLADSIGTPVDKARANAMVGRVLALKGSYDLSLKVFPRSTRSSRGQRQSHRPLP